MVTLLTAEEMHTRLKEGTSKSKRRFHFYCSPHHPGAHALAEELRVLCPATTFTSSNDELEASEYCLVLLTEVTWKRGGASEAYAADILQAMRAGVKCLVVQEVPGARLGDTEARNACSNEQVLAGAMPSALVAAGLSSEKVLELGGDEWRRRARSTHEFK